VLEQGYATVDREKCFSYGMCAEMMPDVFHLDEEGKAVARTGSATPLSKLIETADDCPMQAISVMPSDTSEA